MNLISTAIDGPIIIEPRCFGDHRGFFMETYQARRYKELGIDAEFVQDNVSFSIAGTLRGLHYQHPHGQAKLVQVIQGEVFDVAVDIRRQSPTFGQWVGVYLSQDNRRQFYIPAGFAHGFCVTGETALFYYKCSDYYTPEAEGGVLWNDPDIDIQWPIREPIVSNRDGAFKFLKEIDPDHLPD